MQNLSFSGLASGLDTAAIINSLVSVERLPINLLESKKELAQSKLDLIGTLKGHLNSLKEKASSLSTLGGFLNFKVEASQEGVADFTANENAIAGSHTLSILQVATADRFAFDAVADPDAVLGASGEAISFDINQTNYQINVPAGGLTLNTLAAEIENLAGEDVTASVVNAGTESNPQYQLVLGAKETGEDYRISNITSNIAGLGFDASPPDANGNATSANHISVGNNAIALVDGLQVERSTNSFSDVVEGVTINALAADPGKTINFTVSPDNEEVKAGVQEFVDAYNEVIKFINSQNQFSEDEGASGDLFGDSILRSVRSSLTGALFNIDPNSIQADVEGFSTLSLIGIDLGTNGELSINETQFDEKLAENISAVADLFVDTDGFDNNGAVANTPEYFVDTTTDRGLASILEAAIDRLLDDSADANNGTVKSLFNTRTDALNSDLKRFDTQIEDKERYIVRFEDQLVAKYAALEQLIGRLNTQGDALFAFTG